MLPEIVRFTKTGGPLTKRIRLDENGKLKSDGSACVMSQGEAWRAPVSSVSQLGALISGLNSDQAIALGSLRPGLPDKVGIATKRALNGGSRAGIIARSAQNILFRSGQHGFVLVDYDTKGMPGDVAERIKRAGGCWPALLSITPELAEIARVVRASTSAGLFLADSGAQVPGSNGLHIYLAVRDSADSARFLKTLHDRCWRAGFGWMMVGAGGQLLERSIIDRMVGAPERLVFEGPPILVDPLAQSVEARQPRIEEGDWLDTKAACPPLTVLEKAELAELHAKAKQQLAGESAKAREEFIDRQADELVKRSGVSRRVAIETIRKQCSGILLPTIALPFDDPEIAGKTVADVLADPAAFEGETLADPLEGIAYGSGKAKIMRRADGTLWIHSFAHGRTTYELKLDAAAIRAAMSTADKGDVIAVMIELLLKADVDPPEEDALVEYAIEKTGAKLRSIKRSIKTAREAQTTKQAEEAHERHLAERDDTRPVLPVPAADAPWLTVMDAINSVLSKSKDRIPPARNIDGDAVCVRMTEVSGTHAFVSANEDSDITKEAPPQWVICVMSDNATAEMIERHIDFVDLDDRSVHLLSPFVRHFQRRDDGVLPPLVAVATLPIISADGHLIYKDGLDRKRGIAFNVDPALMEIIPSRTACDHGKVSEAMRFLLEQWLVDVATDLTGKCTLISLALTIIERSLLDQRPTFFVIAGRRGSSKTTALQMILEAVTGNAVAAAAWSTNEEERRKALMSYLMFGVPYILWDNIQRGTPISCPHIERSCTTTQYTDRKLGVSEMVQAAAATVHCFTGNNINPKGDLASRSLVTRLDVDRVDPENRLFKHPDPLGWTRAHRTEILRALYIVLLGNPMLSKPGNAPMKTRFKLWYRLIGSAVEHAARCAAWNDPDTDHVPDQVLDFANLFLDQEADDDEATSLGEMLEALEYAMGNRAAEMGRSHIGLTFAAAEIAEVINAPSLTANAIIIRDFLFENATPSEKKIITAAAIGRHLKPYLRTPVRHGLRTLKLIAQMDKHTKNYVYRVDTTHVHVGV
jgi:hypothetical protein